MPFIRDVDDPQWDRTIPKQYADERRAERRRSAVTAPTIVSKRRIGRQPTPSPWHTNLAQRIRQPTALPARHQPSQRTKRLRPQPSTATRVRDGFVSLTRPTFTPSPSTESVQLSIGARGGAVGDAAPLPLDDIDLSAMPHWLIGLFGGLLAFGFVIAIALWLVQFPPKQRRTGLSVAGMSRWMKLSKGGKGRGYQHLRGHAEEEDSRLPVPHKDDSTATGNSAGGRVRQRKPLSIDTSQAYAGLGIAIPNSNNRKAEAGSSTRLAPPPRPRRRSYDEERLTYRADPPVSPARWAWEALTAPIPSISAFSPSFTTAPKSALDDRRLSGGSNGESSLEKGTHTLPDLAVEDQDWRTPSPYAEGIERSMAKRASGFFEKVGVSIEAAAGKFGRMLSEQVDRGQQEEGLLLPVMDGDREVATW